MQFELKLYKPELGVQVLVSEALTLSDAQERFVQQGWVVLSVMPLRGGWAFAGRTSSFPLLLFSQELLSLLSAGLTLTESIDALQDKEAQYPGQHVLRGLSQSLRVGLSFSDALRRQPASFPPLFRAAIEASERTGDVPDALRRFVQYEQQFQALRGRISSALVYPAVLAGVGALVALFLLTYVVPRFSVVFADRVNDLPLLSGAVIRLGLALSTDPLLYFGLAAGTLIGLAALLSSRTARRWLKNQAAHLPKVGSLVRQYRLSRMYRSLGMLMRGGIPAVQAMEMVSVVLPAAARSAIAGTIADVRGGVLISQALAKHGLTTSVVARLLSVGERSGRMGDMLETASDFLDADLTRTLDRAARLVEPVLMLVVGTVVGGIVVLMYLPVFELAESIR